MYQKMQNDKMQMMLQIKQLEIQASNKVTPNTKESNNTENEVETKKKK
jgi:hypothetical protein